MYLAAFVAVLSLVVFVHEFGHFQVGRWCNIAVRSFSIGMGAEWFGWTDKRGTRWKVSKIPIGGFVSWVDDQDVASTRSSDAAHKELSLADRKRLGHFHAAALWKRFATVAAGPAANFIFSIFAFALLFMVFGRNVTDETKLSPRIDTVLAGSAAEKAGLKPGDIVLSIADQKIDSWAAVKSTVPHYPALSIPITVRRNGELVTVTATPAAEKVTDETGVDHVAGVLGVSRTTAPAERVIEYPGPVAAIAGGAEQVWTLASSTGAYLGNVFSGRASPEHIAGPAGMLGMTAQVTKDAMSAPTFSDRAEALVRTLIAWAATLSVAVGFANLLPIPVLDGGHLLFYLVEAVRGRPLDPKTQALGSNAGLALLACLFLFATWNDLQRLNVLEFLRGIMS
ncbi:MAG TPA: M50 family metallopeptidase [Caulobacterales bacterium]|nr:M50 family metallopeptidase [Caulobacterales bacterium]